MTHILFLTPYYPPEVGAPQTRISETAVRLVTRGHRVTVLTTLPNYPSGIVPPEYRGGQRRREVLDGVDVVRVWSYVRANRGFLGRILAQLSFGCLAGFLGARAVGRPDVIIVEVPPLFATIAGRILSSLKRCPTILTIADIWPEAAVELGALHNRPAIWLAERLEWSSYRRADAIWAVTNGIRQSLVRRGISDDHVFLLPNGVDTSQFRPRDKTRARAELGWDDQFTLLYAGTIGQAQGLETLIHTASMLCDRTDVRLVLIGDGAARAELMAKAAKRELSNMTFLPSQPHERMQQVIAAADACLVSLRKVPLFEGALPSKTFEAMACARAILLAVDGEARRVIADEANAAIYVEPENPSALAQAVLHLRDHPDLAERLGRHGRAFVEAHFDRDVLTAQLEVRIAMVLDRRREKRLVTPSDRVARRSTEEHQVA